MYVCMFNCFVSLSIFKFLQCPVYHHIHACHRYLKVMNFEFYTFANNNSWQTNLNLSAVLVIILQSLTDHVISNTRGLCIAYTWRMYTVYDLYNYKSHKLMI